MSSVLLLPLFFPLLLLSFLFFFFASFSSFTLSHLLSLHVRTSLSHLYLVLIQRRLSPQHAHTLSLSSLFFGSPFFQDTGGLFHVPRAPYFSDDATPSCCGHTPPHSRKSFLQSVGCMSCSQTRCSSFSVLDTCASPCRVSVRLAVLLSLPARPRFSQPPLVHQERQETMHTQRERARARARETEREERNRDQGDRGRGNVRKEAFLVFLPPSNGCR